MSIEPEGDQIKKDAMNVRRDVSGPEYCREYMSLTVFERKQDHEKKALL